MAWVIAIVVVVVLAVLYVLAGRGGIRQKSIDDAHSDAMEQRGPAAPKDGSQWRI